MGISIGCASYKSAVSSSPNANATVSQPTNAIGKSAEPNQAGCSLTMEAAPDVRGLKLGMTPDEVLALFPGSKDDPEVHSDVTRPPSKLGVSSFVIKPAKYQSKEKFAGLNQITINLLDGRVSGFTAGHNGPEFPHVDNFIAKFIEGTNLPPAEAWAPYEGLDNSLKILRCKDFEVRLFVGGPGGNLNYVELHDSIAEKKRIERRDKAKAQAQASPSP